MCHLSECVCVCVCVCVRERLIVYTILKVNSSLYKRTTLSLKEMTLIHINKTTNKS